jgi:hypothetical protein
MKTTELREQKEGKFSLNTKQSGEALELLSNLESDSVQDNLLKLINEDDEARVIAWENWLEIKRIATKMDELAGKIMFPKCKEAIEEILVVMNDVEKYQEWNK